MAAELSLLGTIGLAMGASWASGQRLYACVATLGLLAHFGLAKLPGSLEILAVPWVWGVALALLICEFVADKVPWFDSTWDAIHTFIRIPAGVVLASASFTDFRPEVVAVAALLGGGLAFTSHATKATRRALINHSPEPVSNVAVSLAEDGAGFAIPALGVFVPILAIGFVVVLSVLSLVFLRKSMRAILSLYRKFRERSSRDH